MLIEFKPTEVFPRGKAHGKYKSYMENNKIMKILLKEKHPVQIYSPELWQDMKRREKNG